MNLNCSLKPNKTVYAIPGSVDYWQIARLHLNRMMYAMALNKLISYFSQAIRLSHA